MLRNMAPWAFVLFAASNVLASPLSPKFHERNALVDRGFGCPPDIPCGPGPACTQFTCEIEGCKDADVCQPDYQKRALVDRQFTCPGGVDCGPGPVCTAATCNLPGCADADVCQPDYLKRALVDRQFTCPGGICGHGPVCSPPFCDLPGCADAEACQGSQDQKRSIAPAAALVDRQLACPPGLHCGPGPVCTEATCNLPGCADADVCQNGSRKRSAETDIVHPICDICIVADNGSTVCGCATSSGQPEKRDTEKVCPLFCIVTKEGETLCGCAAEDYEKSLQGGSSS